MFRKHRIAVRLALTFTAALVAGSGQAQTIDFDTFPSGAPVSNNTVITNQYASLGVTFSSPAPAGGPTAGVFAGEASSPPHILTGLHPSTSAGLYPIDMSFAAPYTDWVDVTLISIGCATVTATAYASDSATVLDSISLNRGPSAGVGLGNKDRISLRGDGIALVRFEITATCPTLDGFGIDDVAFSLFAGTAFATYAPTATLTLKPGAGNDTSISKGTFTLAASSDGINPLAEDVTVVIGQFVRTVAAGRFRLDSAGAFRFSGTVGGVNLIVKITPPVSGVYTFSATVKGTSLPGVPAPLAVGLRIGNEGASANLATVKVSASQ